MTDNSIQVDADTKVTQARAKLIQRNPFYACIAMNMDVQITRGEQTCTTDGSTTKFNPDWVADAHPDTVLAALKKMALHVALSHHLRRRDRDPDVWRAACDQVAWHILTSDGDQLPDDATPLPEFKSLPAEQIAGILGGLKPSDDAPPEPGDDDGGEDAAALVDAGAGDSDQGDDPGDAQGDAQGDDGPPQGDGAGDSPDGADGDQGDPSDAANDQAAGGVEDGTPAHDKAGNERAERDVKETVMRAAMAAKAAGRGTETAARFVEQVKASQNDWAARLMMHAQGGSSIDYSFAHPDRRFIGADLYFPGEINDGLGTLGILIDVSGSTAPPEFYSAFRAELQHIADTVEPDRIVVVLCSTKVTGVFEFDCGDIIDFDAKGGGGTDMQPGIDALAGYQPDVVVCLTDLRFAPRRSDDKPLIDTIGVPFVWVRWGEKGTGYPTLFGDVIDMPPAHELPQPT